MPPTRTTKTQSRLAGHDTARRVQIEMGNSASIRRKTGRPNRYG